MNNYEDQYKQETGYGTRAGDGYYGSCFDGNYVKWLTDKLTSETARADKAEGERDELIAEINAAKLSYDKYGIFSFDGITAAINRIKGEEKTI